jgi:hypothetical protein
MRIWKLNLTLGLILFLKVDKLKEILHRFALNFFKQCIHINLNVFSSLWTTALQSFLIKLQDGSHKTDFHHCNLNLCS